MYSYPYQAFVIFGFTSPMSQNVGLLRVFQLFDDLVVTKLVLEVDSRYGKYGRCNICINLRQLPLAKVLFLSHYTALAK